MMQCSSCNTQNQQNARFCYKCGVSLSSGGQAGNALPQPQFGGKGWQSPPTIPPHPPAPPSPMNQPPGHGGIQGIARKIDLRSVSSGWAGGMQGRYQQSIQVLSFRLEQFDPSGNLIQSVSVEMRGLSIPGAGSVRDDDRVKVSGIWENGLLVAKKIHVQRTNTIIVPKGLSPFMKVLVTIMVALFVVALAFVLYNIISVLVHPPSLSPSPPQLSSLVNNSPDNTLNDYCANIQAGAYQRAYDDYSVRLQSQVSSEQFAQMWLNKHLDSCIHDSVQVSGTQATTTISTHEFSTGNTQNYTVTLTQDSNGDWKIDSLQPQ